MLDATTGTADVSAPPAPASALHKFMLDLGGNVGNFYDILSKHGYREISDLEALDDAKLRTLGVTKMRPRKLILNAIAARRAPPTSAPTSPGGDDTNDDAPATRGSWREACLITFADHESGEDNKLVPIDSFKLAKSSVLAPTGSAKAISVGYWVPEITLTEHGEIQFGCCSNYEDADATYEPAVVFDKDTCDEVVLRFLAKHPHGITYTESGGWTAGWRHTVFIETLYIHRRLFAQLSQRTRDKLCRVGTPGLPYTKLALFQHKHEYKELDIYWTAPGVWPVDSSTISTAAPTSTSDFDLALSPAPAQAQSPASPSTALNAQSPRHKRHDRPSTTPEPKKRQRPATQDADSVCV